MYIAICYHAIYNVVENILIIFMISNMILIDDFLTKFLDIYMCMWM